MESNGERDFSDFEHNLRTLLYELNGRRIQMATSQREMNAALLRNLELERQLEMEKRSTKALQMQLEITVQATHRSDAEREALAQKASRSEIQMSLASQEIVILRTQCQKLEMQVMKLNQDLAERSEQTTKFQQFKESCESLQTRVKNAVSTAKKELELLNADVQRLSQAQQGMCRQSQGFQIALQHFRCLEKRQLERRQEQEPKLASLKAKVEELLDTSFNNTMESKEKQQDILKEYKTAISAMEMRLAAEREKSRRLALSFNEAVATQTIMQDIEARLKQQLHSLEMQLETSNSAEAELRKQLEDSRCERIGIKSEQMVSCGVHTSSETCDNEPQIEISEPKEVVTLVDITK